jgi:phosphoribosylcarboxyaminoimidazole (NCAIR) mutase
MLSVRKLSSGLPSKKYERVMTMSNQTDLEMIEIAFDVLEAMDVQHEFEDFCVVHVPKDVMDMWNRAQEEKANG